MAINPPYRFSPIENPVDISGDSDSDDTDVDFEGRVGVLIGTVWLFAANSFVEFPNGPGKLAIRVVTSGGTGPFTQVSGVWSGGSGEGSVFTNDGNAPFIPVIGGGTSGSFHVENSLAQNVGGNGSYSFSGLQFVQNNSNRIFVVDGTVTDGAYNFSQAGDIPRMVTFPWVLHLTTAN